jgi:hypothetical protein
MLELHRVKRGIPFERERERERMRGRGKVKSQEGLVERVLEL